MLYADLRNRWGGKPHADKSEQGGWGGKQAYILWTFFKDDPQLKLVKEIWQRSLSTQQYIIINYIYISEQ